MSTMTEFLRKQKVAERNKDIDMSQIKREWLSAIKGLFQNTKQWLSEAQREGLIDIKEEQVDIYEERLGKYRAPSLSLKTGKKTVKIRPIGKTIIGADGRVDMESPKGAFVLLYLSDKDVWVHGRGSRPADFQELDKALFENLLKRLLA